MCRSRELILVLLVALCAHCTSWAAVADADGGEAVAAFLERHDLTELLAVHLEQQIDVAEGEQRSELILRLGLLYARLLETVDDPQRREALELRSQRLLSMTDADGGEELRLALLRAAYRPAEQIIENHRLRLASEQDLERAAAVLADLVPKLHALQQQLERGTRVSDNRLNRVRDGGIAILSERVGRLSRLHGQATFLLAWALYHTAWLNDRVDLAREAEGYFAEALLSDSPRPQPEEISVDLRSEEPFARSILGMALCRSLTASAATSLRWLELLEVDSAFAPVREQLDAWKIAVLLEHQEYRSVDDIIVRYTRHEQSLPIAWLRLVAVHALEAPRRDPAAMKLVQFAVAEIAARGELDQVLDLAERYGVQSLGDSGFALHYVSGVLVYRQARQLHGSDEPVGDVQTQGLYRQAVEHLSAALEESDVDDHPNAAAACMRLMAWALYFQGEFLQAQQQFEGAAQHLPDEEVDDALWMSIVCYDRLIDAGGSQSLSQRRDELVEQFLAAYPASRHAPALQLRRALASERLSSDALADLLSVEPGHPAYLRARQRASDELYHVFRESRGEQRVMAAHDFLDVAVQLLEGGFAVDAPSIDRAVVNLRRTLEVALTEGVQGATAAELAMQVYEQLAAGGHIDTETYRDEMLFRQLQWHLHQQDVIAAGELADRLWEQDQRAVWTRMASRRMFEYAHQRRVAGNEQMLTLMARYGGRVLREFDDDQSALANPQVVAYYAAVAEALTELWGITNDQQHGRAALFLYQRMLSANVNSAPLLRSAAILSESLDEREFAATCWRRLAAGTRQGSEPWFEARYHLLAILAEDDPARARQVMTQHRQMYPQFGPEPWGARMRQLEEQLNAGAAPQ